MQRDALLFNEIEAFFGDVVRGRFSLEDIKPKLWSPPHKQVLKPPQWTEKDVRHSRKVFRKTYCFKLAYHGPSFNGWQDQRKPDYPTVRTTQQAGAGLCLGSAIRSICGGTQSEYRLRR